MVLGIAGDVHGDVAGSLEPPRHAILHLRLEGAEHGRPAQPGLGRVETVVELLGAERAAGVRERPRDEDTLRREAPPARADAVRQRALGARRHQLHPRPVI